MRFTQNADVLTAYLAGEIDHHSARLLREETDEALLLRRPKTLVLDFSGVSFMDSSGVGLVLGRYKKAAAIGCRTAVRGAKPREKRILALSGLPQLVEFMEAPQEKTESRMRT